MVLKTLQVFSILLGFFLARAGIVMIIGGKKLLFWPVQPVKIPNCSAGKLKKIGQSTETPEKEGHKHLPVLPI